MKNNKKSIILKSLAVLIAITLAIPIIALIAIGFSTDPTDSLGLISIFFWGGLLGLFPAMIAHNKGRSFFWFWLYGTLIFIIALPDTLLMKPNTRELEKRALSSGGKKCPHCAEIIKSEAKVCRFCGRDI